MLISTTATQSGTSAPSDLASSGTGSRPWAWGVGSGRGGSARCASSDTNSYVRQGSATSLGLASPGATAGKPEVPPRGLLYAASVSELSSDSHRNQVSASTKVLGTANRSPEDYIRRVASAPQLPVTQPVVQHLAPERQALADQLGRSRGAGIIAGAVSGIGINISSSSAARSSHGSPEDDQAAAASSSSGGGANSAGTGTAGSTTFETNKFLSLAKQPGAKTAALQYLMSSTRNALGTIGESHEGRSPSKTPATSPARSASVGSVGGVNAVGGQLPSHSVPHEPSINLPSHRSVVPQTSMYGGATGARPAHRGQLIGGSGAPAQSSEFSRERTAPLPSSATMPSMQPASTQPQTQPRPVAATQAQGYSMRPPGSVPGNGFAAAMAARRQHSQTNIGQIRPGQWPPSQ
jgi:hypothetical protein